MSKERGYKDSGDRVIVINPAAFGKHGMVAYNDGFGEVAVTLDEGGTFRGYEGRDLIYEDEKLPQNPIDVGPASPETSERPDEAFIDPEGQRIGTITKLNRGEVTE